MLRIQITVSLSYRICKYKESATLKSCLKTGILVQNQESLYKNYRIQNFGWCQTPQCRDCITSEKSQKTGS